MKEFLLPVVKVAPRIPHDAGKTLINGPAIYSVSPGKPCLYMFPVCGEVPLRFEAAGDLPPSPIQISCDLNTINDFTLDLFSNEEILE